MEACAAAARDYSGSVAAAFDTNVAKVRSIGLLSEPPRWAGLAADHPAAYSFIDAEIAKGPPPGPDETIAPSFERVVVVVVDGESMGVMYGPRDQLPVRAP